MATRHIKKVVLSKNDIKKALQQYAGVSNAEVELVFIDLTSRHNSRTKSVSLDTAILRQYK
jgi:hypothetical protein